MAKMEISAIILILIFDKLKYNKWIESKEMGQNHVIVEFWLGKVSEMS